MKRIFTKEHRKNISLAHKGIIRCDRGNKHRNWKGGKVIINNYIAVYMPSHPFAKNKTYVYLHRLVIEKYIGRYLKTIEQVHHKNFNKQDNRLCNLQIVFVAEHRKLHGKNFKDLRCKNEN